MGKGQAADRKTDEGRHERLARQVGKTDKIERQVDMLYFNFCYFHK